MSGLIVDLDWMVPRLSLTGEDEAGHRVSRRPPGASGAPGGSTAPAPAATSTRSALMPSRRHAGEDTAALLGRALVLGYIEKPAPNAGIRRMRLINFLKAKEE